MSPSLGADKYTFSTKAVPAGTKEVKLELVDEASPNTKMTVKVDLVCAGGGAALKLPGPCVDPAADAMKRAEPHTSGTSASVEEMVSSDESLDVDGDGTKDRIFLVGLNMTDAQLVYVMRGSCGHYVGDLGGGASTPLSSKHSGLPDFAVDDTGHCEGTRGLCKPVRSVVVFNGTEYQLKK